MTTTAHIDVAEFTPRLVELSTRHDVPSVAVGVYTSGRFSQACHGVISRRTGVEVTDDTLWQIGSITKVYTALLVMTLVEEGRADLDVPLREYVPDLALADPDTRDRVTLRHLLTHRSGVVCDWFPETAGRGDDCRQRLVAGLGEQPLAHPLDATTSYSNTAYALVGYAVERILGCTYEQALLERVLRPLQLDASFTFPEEVILHRAAVGHVGSGPAQTVPPIWGLPRAATSAGGIVCSIEDVVRFGCTFLDEAGVHPQRTATDMTTATVSWPGIPVEQAVGWGVRRVADHTVLTHNGSTIGLHSTLHVLPDLDTVIAVTGSGEAWTSVRDAVVAEILDRIGGPDLTVTIEPTPYPAAIEPSAYVGWYERPGIRYRVLVSDQTMFLEVHPPPEFAMFALSTEPVRWPMHANDIDAFVVNAGTADAAAWAPLQFLRLSGGDVDHLHLGGRAVPRTESG